jgi:hypothetical protein
MRIDPAMQYGVSELSVSVPASLSSPKLMAAAKVKKQPRGVCLVSSSVIMSKEIVLTSDHQPMGEYGQAESGKLTGRTIPGISISRPWSELSRQDAR